MKGSSTGPSRVDRAAFCGLLVSAGVLDRELASRVAHLGGYFPAIAGLNVFLEYELQQQPIPAGFGVGFPLGLLNHYTVTNHWFSRSPIGRAIEAALLNDPFEADHAIYLNLLNDSDPDWIEYDIDDRRIDPQPFVFFRFPFRFQTIQTSEQARGLCEILPGCSSPPSQFSRMLDLLVNLGPACMYRVGVSQRRGTKWWRAIITNLLKDQVTAALNSLGGTDFEGILEFAQTLYAGRVDTAGARFALSIDIESDRISAMDVECPYLLRIGDATVKTTAFRRFLKQLSEAEFISDWTANWLAENCSKTVVAKRSDVQLRVAVHHLKYRFFGSPHLRTKAYFHLIMTDGSADYTAR